MVGDEDKIPTLGSVGAFPGLARDVGFAECIFDALGCVPPHNTTGLFTISADILLNQNSLQAIRGVGPPAIPGDVRFNKCLTMADRAYEVLVHEAGHALGIGAIAEEVRGYNSSHPFSLQSPDTVMSYQQGGLGCSPHPFDIVAIYALYQTR